MHITNNSFNIYNFLVSACSSLFHTVFIPLVFYSGEPRNTPYPNHRKLPKKHDTFFIKSMIFFSYAIQTSSLCNIVNSAYYELIDEGIVKKKTTKIMANSRASSIDVAKLANVSQATVSRVLNHPEKVGEETKRKVYAAIKELKYVPNQNARDLVSGQSKVITLISGPLENPFFVDSTSAIVHYATEQGYKVNIIIADDKGIEDSYRLALSNRPDGLIMSCILYEDSVIEHLQGLDIPFVSYNRRHREKLNYVELDNLSAGKQACEYLHQKGYKSIFWVGGTLDVSTFYYRYKGFLEQYLQTYSTEINTELIINDPILEYSKLEQQLLKWFQNTSGKKAIAAATDSIAINLLNLTKKIGISCPEDIGIIGIDNVDLSQHAYINLTTIGNEENLGYIAITELIDSIKDPIRRNINITLPVKIFERGTTK